jgi:hypothetical protein
MLQDTWIYVGVTNDKVKTGETEIKLLIDISKNMTENLINKI